MNRKVFAVLLVGMLILAGLPPASAQGGLSDEEQALMDRAVAALETAHGYRSYQASTVFSLFEGWTGSLSGEVVAGQTVSITRSEEIAAADMDTQPNVSRTITVTQSAAELDSPPNEYTLEADVRAVDGTVYVNAGYAGADSDWPALPDGWTVVSGEADFSFYPGLDTVLSRDYVNDQRRNVALSGLVAGRIEALPAAVTGATAEAITLEDGTPAEAITMTVNRDGVRMLGIFFNSQDPVEEFLFEQVEGDPLTLTLTVDPAGNLLRLDLAFTLAFTDLDIGGVADAPPGLKLTATLTQTYSARFASINAPLELVQAPEILPVTARPGFSTPEETATLPWWNHRVFYEVFVRSFYDSDGDGIGDLRGLIEKLDYLNDGDPATTADLGVTGIWLMPVAQSPSYHGYDVTDYYTIEEDYGTNEDFLALIAAAHERGIAVIVDLVMNHTSSEHPWFVASRAGDPTYQQWYIWSDTNPGYLSPWNSTVWHQAGDRYYYGLFWEGMPDLNYRNPAVTAAMHDVIRFWLEDMGVDGFRLDAVRHLIEDGPIQQNTPATLAWLEGFHDYVHGIRPDVLTVGEVWDTTSAVVPYVDDRLDIAFEFDLAAAILQSLQWGTGEPLYQTQSTVLDLYPPEQYAAFLTNHDQDRVMSQLGGNIEAAKVAATLLLTNPGVPFIYYGEEVGMQGVSPDENRRTPMQWDSTRIYGGFTTGSPWEPLALGYRTFNVANMTGDPDSLLSHYRRLIGLRESIPVLQTGPMQLVAGTDRRVYSFLRYGEGEAVLVVVNLSGEAVEDYALYAPESALRGGLTARLLLGEGEAVAPALDALGGFAGYAPLDVLPPLSSTLILLRQEAG